MYIELTFFAFSLAAVAALFSSIFQSISGFAGALMLAVLIAPIFGVKESVPLTASAMLISGCARVWVFRKFVPRKPFFTVMIVALPLIILSAHFYLSLDPKAAALVLGTFLLCSTPLRISLNKLRVNVSLRGLAIAAIPYGLLSGSTFGAGLILAPFMMGAGITKERLVAMVGALALGLNLSKTLVFGSSALMGSEMLFLGLAIGLFTLPGPFIGRWILKNTDVKIHSRFLDVFVFFSSLYFLYVGLST